MKCVDETFVKQSKLILLIKFTLLYVQLQCYVKNLTNSYFVKYFLNEKIIKALTILSTKMNKQPYKVLFRERFERIWKSSFFPKYAEHHIDIIVLLSTCNGAQNFPCQDKSPALCTDNIIGFQLLPLLLHVRKNEDKISCEDYWK